MDTTRKLPIAALASLAAFAACSQDQLGESEIIVSEEGARITVEQARETAKEAYIFGFPFVANYRVFMARLIERDPMMMGADFNEFAHQRELIPPETPDTAQRDTVYSFGIIDLRREPMVISVPDVPDGQAYMLQMGDTSTESLPYISTKTTENKAGDYVLVGPDYQGFVPSQPFAGIITTRGQMIVMIGRTVVFDPDDLSPIHAIQDGMTMQPLSQFLGIDAPPEQEPATFIPFDSEKADGVSVFEYINMALGWHPAATYENDIMASFAAIGVAPGQPFSTDGLPPAIVAAMNEGIAEAQQELEVHSRTLVSQVNGWSWVTEDISRFGTDYLLRAAVALRNIYPNEPDHAIYGQTFTDFDGQALRGENRYTLRIEAGQLPPVDWFWSLTLYDASTSTMFTNELGRQNIGGRTKGLVTDDDGSLTIYIQNEEPSDTNERANWLPAPEGEIYVVLRLYAPKPEVARGEWTPPPLNLSR